MTPNDERQPRTRPVNAQTQADADGPTGPAPASRDRYGSTLADAASDTTRVRSTAATGSGVGLLKIIAKIGEGGMGSVHLAFDPARKRHVAVKRLSPEVRNNEKLRQRLLTEGRAARELFHHHIVGVFDAGEDAEGPYIVMEYIPGPNATPRVGWPADAPNPPLDLERYVQLSKKRDVKRAVQWCKEILAAIKHAHSKNIIHRDIKPANVLLTSTAETKLADFGLARELDLKDTGKTLAGAQLLTLGYGAPEQEVDASRADHRADIYSIGATLWYLVTGQNPRFYREADAPEELREILARAMHRQREERFQSADEFLAALASIGEVSTQAKKGICPKCKHRHGLDQAGNTNIKFCENCGQSLEEPCLNCSLSNGIWSKFCGTCGVDLAETASKSEAARLTQLKAALSSADTGEFEKAISNVEVVSRLSHPRLAKAAGQASELLSKLKQRYKTALADQDAKVAAAKALFEKHDYDECQKLVLQIPEPIRTSMAKEMLKAANDRSQELSVLKALVAKGVTDGQYSGLGPKVDRILELTPADSYHQNVRDFLRKHEQKKLDSSWVEAQEAGTSAALENFLADYGKNQYSNEALELLAETLREEIIANPTARARRARYLSLRTVEQQAADESSAAWGSVGAYAIVGVTMGIVGGFSVGGINLAAGIVSGAVVGLAAAIVGASRK